jgi:small subunit ribosomal protein S4
MRDSPDHSSRAVASPNEDAEGNQMARYLGPKVKLSRRVGVPIADIPKHTSKRQLSPPGMHGFRGRRIKDYGIRKDEKQKLRYHYNVLERQFRGYLATATRRPGNTGENLLQILECRLDNVIRRAGFTRTIWAARQFVVHGHIMINGRKVDRPSYQVQIGDVITVRSKDSSTKLARESMESLAGHMVPGWAEVNPAELTIRIVARPTSDQIPFDVNTNLIVEFYR